MEGEAQKQGKKVEYWASAIPQPDINSRDGTKLLCIILKGTKALWPHRLSSWSKDLIVVMQCLE